MAALPDGVAVVKFNDDQLIVASVEATEQAKEAKQIAAKYKYKLITCDIGEETWNKCKMLFTLWRHLVPVLLLEKLCTL